MVVSGFRITRCWESMGQVEWHQISILEAGLFYAFLFMVRSKYVYEHIAEVSMP